MVRWPFLGPLAAVDLREDDGVLLRDLMVPWAIILGAWWGWFWVGEGEGEMFWREGWLWVENMEYFMSDLFGFN